MAEIDLVFDPDNFVRKITDPNSFFPLVRGNKWVYEEVDGPVVTDKVTGTKNILGVKCTVVTVTAQDGDGNVWYLGVEESRRSRMARIAAYAFALPLP